MPIEISLYQLVFSKEYNLLITLEHKALWVLNKLKLSWKDEIDLMLDQLNKMDDFYFEDSKRVDLL